MADYKRVVSYMYNYENHVKHNNIGFSRIETKNGQCKITIHLKVLSLSEKEIKAYIFNRENDDIRCLHIGDIEIKNGIGDMKITTKMDNLMESGFQLSDMGGIVVYASEDKYYGTEWDDKPILIKTLHQVTKATEKLKQSREQAKEESFNLHRLGEDTLKVASKEEPQASAYFSEVYEGTIHQGDSTDNTLQEESVKIEEPDIQTAAISRLEYSVDANEEFDYDKELPFEAIRAIDIRANKAVIECLGDFKSCESDQENEEIRNEIQVLKARIQQLSSLSKQWEEAQKQRDVYNNVSQPILQIDSISKADLTPQEDNPPQKESLIQETQPSQEENNLKQQDVLNKQSEEAEGVAQRIFKRYPRMRPFEDSEIQECVRIEPQDIGVFPMQAWILANNSFLLHGYYSYRHLIFAKRRRGKGYQYILGVPGINHNRERFIAKMFGFEMFKSTKKKESNEGEFGYWFLEIALLS